MNHVRSRHVDTCPISMSIKSKAIWPDLDPVAARRRRASANYGCTTTLFRSRSLRCGFNSAGHVRINTAVINDRRSSTELSRFLGRIFLRRRNGELAFLAGGLNSTKKPKRLKLGGSKKSGGFVGGEIRACPRAPRHAVQQVWQLSDVLEPRGQRTEVYVLHSAAFESGIHACLCM